MFRKRREVKDEPINLVYPLRGGLARCLEETLIPGEQVLAQMPTGGEALIVTAERVVVLKAGFKSGATFGRKAKSFPLDQISSVEVSRGLTMGRLQISAAGTIELSMQSAAGDSLQAENVVNFGVASTKPSPGYKEFVAAGQLIRSLMAKARTPKAAAILLNGLADEVAKLAALRERGIITADDFEAGKRKLLGL
jgi:hypothetical protein